MGTGSFWSASRCVFKTCFFQHISNLFLILNETDYDYYVDDSTLYKACENIDDVSETLRMSAKKIFKCFKSNQI